MKKFVVLIALVTVSLTAVVNAKGMTLEDVSKVQNVTSMAVSPDGQWIAYTKSKPRTPYQDEDGKAWNELYLLSVKPGRTNQPRPYITGDVSIGGLSWSKDSSFMYYLAKRGDDKYNSLYRIAVDGGESQQVVSHDASIASFSLNAKGNQVAFVAKDKKPGHVKTLAKKGFKAKVYEEDIQLNKLWLVDTDLNTDDKPEAMAVKGHVIGVQFNPKKQQLLVQTSPTSLIDDVYMQASFQVINMKAKVIQKFATRGKLGKAKWSTNGNHVAFLAANDFNDPTNGALYVAKVSNGQVNKRVPNITSHIKDLAWHHDDLIYIEHQGLESRVVKMALTREIADRTVVDYGQGIQSNISVDDQGQVYVLNDTASHPREIFSLGGKVPQRLTDSNPWLNDIELAKQTGFEYAARDGLKIQGVLVYPLNYKKGKRYPMIAFIHGGPESHRSNGWNTRYSDPLQVAAAQGYFAFVPNYRGSTGRGDEFARADQHAYADPEFTDIVDGKLALVEQGMVDSDRVGITGGSYGGFATAWSATALSEHYAAGVMFVGISNQLSKFGTTDIPNEMHAVHARAWPWDDYQWMLERSPIYHVKKAKTPLLIMHGEDDTRVHPSQSMEMYRYLKTLGQAPVRLVLYPGEGHGNRKAGAQLDYSLRLMRWMDHYLKGKGGQPPAYDLKHEEKLKDKKDEA